MKCGLRVCRAGKGALPTAMGREATANRRWQGDVSGLSFRELALVDKRRRGQWGPGHSTEGRPEGALRRAPPRLRCPCAAERRPPAGVARQPRGR